MESSFLHLDHSSADQDPYWPFDCSLDKLLEAFAVALSAADLVEFPSFLKGSRLVAHCACITAAFRMLGSDQQTTTEG